MQITVYTDSPVDHNFYSPKENMSDEYFHYIKNFVIPWKVQDRISVAKTEWFEKVTTCLLTFSISFIFFLFVDYRKKSINYISK